MINTFIQKARLLLEDPVMRKRIYFVIFALLLSRILAVIPIPGIDPVRLAEFFTQNQFLGLINIFTGGGLATLSIVMLGVGPYITGSIIMQLVTVISPKLKAMYQEEGEAGRKKFAQYSRMISVPLALLQAFGFLTLLGRQGVLPQLGGLSMLVNIVIITAGSVLLMWIGELISEYGVGNGVSLIILAGIIAGLPQSVGQLLISFQTGDIPVYLAFLVAAALIILGVVIVTEAERPIPVTYAKRVRGNKIYGGLSTYLPIRINQAGVIPIIFALSILLFPQMIFNFFNASSNAIIQEVSRFGTQILSNQWFYGIAYFVLIFLFTYFYTAVTFDPDQMANNLQKNGAFIPGVRPGPSTSEYVAKILTRLTLVGAVFLGIIAVLPLVMRALTGIQAFAIGGTALLIVVSVVLDLVKKLDAQVTAREY
ncbi:MAG TPA: preprotein translocase subunit SecY [Candidatus Paceibacterota bacterium]